MNGIIVKLENVNGKQVPAVTSQQLAEVFGKEHYNVLRDIRETVAKCSKSFCALNFEGAEYLDEQGKSRPMYLMTKDGFTMVAMAYTTPEAMRFKEAYIAEFNRMEAELQRGTQQSLPEFPAKIEAAAIILRVAGITGNQAALSLDKVYRREAGYSFLETVEVALEAPTKRQILNPTELGKALARPVAASGKQCPCGYELPDENHERQMGTHRYGDGLCRDARYRQAPFRRYPHPPVEMGHRRHPRHPEFSGCGNRRLTSSL